ncbi:uncharacterized protein [Rutidosis leptorrhynchoides]|uniref:uncharacterized protein n=1 Tax=Rutidosis leptorrhynchoides TaxID=125765 RepID=UPI003A99719A
MSQLKMFRLRSLWGNPNFNYSVSLSRGYSSGIISMWDPCSFVKSNMWCDENFVIVKGKWLRENLEVYMVNVYAPQSVTNKVIVWNKLSSFMSSHSGDFIFLDDWNAVRTREERCGTEFCHIDAQAFNDFIEGNMLYEVPLGGLQYTWRNKAGNKLSKLDRFFVTNNILNVVDDLKGTVLARGQSDHSPILLFKDNVDFGPTYFKIFESWFQRPDFDTFVHSSWDEICKTDNRDIVAKLRNLKSWLKSWIHTSRSSEAIRLDEVSKKINDIDLIIDAGQADDTMINSRTDLNAEREELFKLRSLDAIQKSRIKWDVEGDENSKFFHCSLKHKRSTQHIQGLMVDGSWIVNPDTIKDQFHNYYKAKFDCHNTGAEFYNVDPHYKLNQEEASYLEREVDDTEIKRAVWDCGSSKALS